jgi:cytochrome c biogenesis protein CcmG, thiol:disulfide interchange protein DsbE
LGHGPGLARRLLLACAVAWLAAATAQANAPLDLSTFKGQVVYVDFWASWCAPCRQSFPWMQSMKNAYGSQGLAVVAVNLDENRADADKFLQRFHPDFEIRFDPQGTLAEAFKVEGMPTSLVVDRHGVVRYTHIGFRPDDREALEKQLRSLLAEK